MKTGDVEKLRGLSSAEVVVSRQEHGANLLTPPPRESALKIFLSKFLDPVVAILCLAALVSLLTGGAIESIGILLAVLLSTGIAFFNEYRAGQEFDILNRTEDSVPVKTKRDGELRLLPKCELVVGDILFVEAGEEIPADAEILEAVDFRVDESKFTGEAEPAPKFAAEDPECAEYADATYPPDRVLRGATVAEGNAWLRVVAVGDATELGKTARAAGEAVAVPTPLQRQLARLGKVIAGCGISLSILLLLILIAKAMAAGELPAWFSQWPTAGQWGTLLGFFMVAITLIVMAVPEGLPMSVTLSLAYSMKRMARSNCLVRKLHACETIGAATTICTDKTGTLTMNEMRVEEVFFTDTAAWLDEALCVNTTAALDGEKVIGNPTEGALLRFAREHGADYLRLRRGFATEKQWPFSTATKFMASCGNSAVAGGRLIHLKGAPELVLGMCSSRMTASGEVPLDEPVRAELGECFLEAQRRGARTIGFAVRLLPGAGEIPEPGEGKFAYLGFVAIADPVRPEVPDAVSACRRAGIDIKIVTGDTPATATEIGRAIGLWKRSPAPGEVMTGTEFAALDSTEVAARVRKLKLIARARPEDKLRLVRSLRLNCEVVAVTGDGTNDAPALRHADVGVAMGRCGTAVAREAAEIILLDDSFKSIVNAVLWGRSLYLNIQKFLVFQLTINVAAIGVALLGPFFGVALPLTVIQMLWINLIMDTLASLALATEPPDPRVMDNPPRPVGAFIVTPAMARWIFLTAAGFIALFLAAAVAWRGDGTSTRELTLIFNGFVFLQVWNLFNARMFGRSGSVFSDFWSNRVFLVIVLAIVVVQVVITSFGGAVFRTEPLRWADWLTIAAATSLVLWIGETVRWWKRWRKRRRGSAAVLQ